MDGERHDLALAIDDRSNTPNYAPADDFLILDGMWDKRAIHVVLRHRGFNWVAEFPFNR